MQTGLPSGLDFSGCCELGQWADRFQILQRQVLVILVSFNLIIGFDYFVDASSTLSNIELGTKKHPFKALDDPFRELFNHGVPYFANLGISEAQNFNVYLKHGSNATLHTDDMPLIIANVGIQVKPYLDDQQVGKVNMENNHTEIRIYHMDYYRQPTANFNPTFDPFSGTPYPYNYEAMIKLALVPDSILTEQKFKIMIYNANFTSRYIKWVEVTSEQISGNSLFVLHGGPYTTLIIDSSTLALRAFLFVSFEGVNVKLTNNQINITNLYYLFLYHSLEKCDYFLPENTGIANNLIFDNNTVFGNNYQDTFFLIYFENQGNITISNNYFNGTLVSQDAQILFEQFEIECPFDFYTFYLIENNTDVNILEENGRPAKYSHMYYNILMATTGQQDVIIRNNYYQNIKLRDHGIYYITNSITANAHIIIENITFSNVENIDVPSPFIQVIAMDVQLNHIQLLNSEITRFIHLETLSASIANIHVENIYRVNDGLAQQAFDSFFFITQCQELSLTNITIQDSKFHTNTVFSLINTANVVINRVNITNSLAFSGHIFYLYILQGLRANNIIISNVYKESLFVVSAIQMEILKDSRVEGEEILYSFDDLTFKNSNMQFMQLNELSTTEYRNPISVIFRNTHLQEINLGRKDNLVRVNSIIYPNLNLDFHNSSLQDSSADFGFIRFQQSGNTTNITNFKAVNNSGNFMTVSSKLNQTVSISNINLTQNFAPEALFIIQSNAKLMISDSIFEDNFSLARGSILLGETSTSETNIANSVFNRNYAFQGGVIFVQTFAKLTVRNSNFTNNFAHQGGILYQQGEGLANLIESKFEENLAFYGSIIYSINSLSQIEIKGGSITRNGFHYINKEKANRMFGLLNANQSTQMINSQFIQVLLSKQALSIEKLLSLQYSSVSYQILIIKALITMSNKVKVSDQAMLLQQTSASITNIDSLDYSNTSTSFPLISTESSIVTINLFTMRNITSTTYAIECHSDTQGSISAFGAYDSKIAPLYITSSSLSMSNWTIRNLALPSAAHLSMIEVSHSSITIKGFLLSQIHAASSDHQQVFYASESQVQIHSLNAEEFKGKLFTIEEQSHFSLTNSSIANNLSPNIPNLFTIQASDGLISNCTFQNLKSLCGPALYAWSPPKLPTQKQITLINAKFISNTAAQVSGAIFARDIDLDVQESSFINNRALTGNGGAIFASCTQTNEDKCNYTIQDNKFELNIANSNGGAIYYDLYAPVGLKDNIFLSNKGLYGDNYASYPYMLKLLQKNLITGFLQEQQSKLSFVSGQEYSNILIIGLFDQNNQLVIIDSESEGILMSSDLNVQISGNNKVIAQNGVYTFTNLKFVSNTNYSTTITFLSSALDSQKIGKITTNQAIGLEVEVKFRECIEGETIKNSMCVQCPKGSYSFNSSNTQVRLQSLNLIQCQQCFKNGNCIGGNITLVDEGYWRSTNKSTILFSCPASESCLGGLNSECALGYTGRMCSICEKNKIKGEYYARSGPYKCTKCSPFGIQMLYLFCFLVGLSLYVIFIIYQLLNNPSPFKPQTVLMRILTNYSQAIMIVYEFNLNWPHQVSQALEYFSSINSAQEYVFSFDCIYKQLNIGDSTPFLYKEVIKYGLMPIFFSLVAALIWYFIHQYYLKIKKVQICLERNIKVSMFVIVYLIYPSIINFSFSLFNCFSLDDGNSYLKRDFQIQCWTSEHKLMALPIGLCFIFVWVIGFPAVIFYILNKNKDKLSQREFILEYGLFYVGLTEEAYFWEVIVSNIRKIIFVSCSTLLSSFNPIIKAIIAVAALIVQMQMSHNFSPYIDPRFDQIEHLGIYSSVFTVFMGLIYVQNDIQKSNSAQLVVFLFIMATNLLFFIQWIRSFATVILRTQMQRLQSFKYLSFLTKIKINDYHNDLQLELHKLHKRNSISKRERYYKQLSNQILKQNSKDGKFNPAESKEDKEFFRQASDLVKVKNYENSREKSEDSFASEFSSRSLIDSQRKHVRNQIEGFGARKKVTARGFRSKGSEITARKDYTKRDSAQTQIITPSSKQITKVLMRKEKTKQPIRKEGSFGAFGMKGKPTIRRGNLAKSNNQESSIFSSPFEGLSQSEIDFSQYVRGQSGRTQLQ
ncbi:hypothetical protein FGO68_gene11233 [Halteria grandinella]|uniref:Transmembrane protein n=1 Tax=Halteria grandinella TaxID=5974 RepID=A0A8J8P5F2_HALGN|nr:hypothetical protein FGO68_gene11233 [Halteria grandinella]